MSFTEFLGAVRARTDARLTHFFEAKRRFALETSADSLELVSEVEALTMRGGKRLRAALVEAALLAVDPHADRSRAGDVSAALELLQTYLLIHDDWMDGDVERRGGPSVHVSLESRYTPHIAASLAILAGDLACTYAFELMADAPFAPSRLRDAMLAFVRTQEEVFFGQHLDVAGLGDVSRMHHLKTGSYTARGPLRLGGLLGDASPAQLAALDAFGAPLGLAFQLRDDLLGTFGDPSATGKPIGNDLRVGKRTALIEAAYELVSETQRASIAAVLGDEAASERDILHVTELLVTCGAKARVESRLEAHLTSALAVLGERSLGEHELLGELAHAMARRDR